MKYATSICLAALTLTACTKDGVDSAEGDSTARNTASSAPAPMTREELRKAQPAKPPAPLNTMPAMPDGKRVVDENVPADEATPDE